MIATSLVLHHQNVKLIIYLFIYLFIYLLLLNNNIFILFYLFKKKKRLVWMYGPTQSLAQWSMSFYMQCHMQLGSSQFWVFDQVVWGM
jgi:hypothetical protein